MQQLQPNTTLQGGKYRIERVLGQGGFGNTYVGVNTTFDDNVAIKEFFMQGINDRDDASDFVTVSLEENRPQFEEQREKFKKEALRIRKLDNPYIVKVYDLFEENGTVYYVMDYVDGENLAERLKHTGKPMTEQEVRDILLQLLDALKAVHDAGMWHLDLKPANIMLDKSGNVKLIDFGASKQLNAQKGGATTSTAVSYTNGYAPREQMEQNYDKFGPWTDIYALGATLYNLLTKNRPPMPSDIDDDLNEDKHNALPFSGDVSDEMKQMVLWMMKTNRNQRPHDIDSVYFKLEQYDSTPNDEDVDESTIVLESNNKKEITSTSVSLSNNNSKSRLKYYFGFSITFIILCAGILFWNYNGGELNIKPQYKVIREKDKTCELVGNISKGIYYLSYSMTQNTVSCIPDTAYGAYTIPSEVDGYKVISLGDFSFCKTRLTDVVIPPTVRSIGEGAFSACKYLSSISIPEGVEEIPVDAFHGSNISIVSLPSTIKTINTSAFNYCRKLSSISIPEGVEVISKYAFKDCGSLSGVHLPSTIKCIKDSAFMDCENLTSISIPEGVEEISGGVFSRCNSLSNISLPSTIKRIKDYAFYRNKSLSSIVIPEGIEEISMKAFYNTSLTSLHLPKNIHTIFDRDTYGYVFRDELYSNSEPNFSRLKTVVSDIPDPLVISYRNGNGDLLYREDPLTVPSSFSDLPKDAVLYIPKGSKDLYKRAGWNIHFSKVIER